MDAAMSINVTPVVSVALVIVSTIVPILSLMSIILRFQARRIGRLKLAADDWWILAGWACILKPNGIKLIANVPQASYFCFEPYYLDFWQYHWYLEIQNQCDDGDPKIIPMRFHLQCHPPS